MRNNKRKLKICIDARIRDGEAGGIQQVVIGLASEFSRFESKDEEYYFLCYDDSSAWLEPYMTGRCKKLSVGSSSSKAKNMSKLKKLFPLLDKFWGVLFAVLGRKLIAIPRSNGVIEAEGIDVMHFSHQNAFTTSIPSIYHPHDLQHIHLPEYFSPRQRLLRNVSYREFSERAKLVAVTSRWVKQDLISNLDIPSGKISVIPLASVLSAYPTPNAEAISCVIKKYDLPGEFAFYPAKTWAHKNHIKLLEALAVLRDEFDLTVPVVFSGGFNSHFVNIQSKLKELNLQAQVKFVGFVEPLELQCLYKLAKLVVIPTKFEAASFPLWESFSAGVAVACSNVTSLPEQANKAALLFDPNNTEEIAESILRLWTNKQLRALMISRGNERLKDFDWKETAKVFNVHYRKIAGCELGLEEKEILGRTAAL